MKKLIIMAVSAIIASTAFAQDDALKTILKSKDTSEVETLLSTNLSSFSSEQKAKAYNKLVTLYMEKVNHELATINANQLRMQMQQGEPEQYDTIAFFNGVYKAMQNAIECDKYDNQANDKGKIAPKFHKANRDKLYSLRMHLISGGQYAADNNRHDEALKNYVMYVETSNTPLFADVENKVADLWVGEVARVAAVYSYQNKDLENAHKYCDVALQDTATYQEALNLKLYLMEQGLTTREDSLACLKKYEDLYAKDKSEQVFNSLAEMYGDMGMTDKQLSVINERIAMDPNCFTAWAMRGQTEMNEGEWDVAIADFKKSLEINPNSAIILTYMGFSLNAKATNSGTLEEQKALYMESLSYLEKARSVDPTRQEANWSYPLYQCYYTLYGEDDSRTKEVEALVR